MADIAFIPRCQERVKRKMKKIDHFALKNFLSTKIGNKTYYSYEHPKDPSFRWEGEAWDKKHARNKAQDAYSDHSNNKNVDEGITDYLPSMDSVSAFGRNVADTATFGTYKYARAGADYVAKKALKATGLSKNDTTYSRELDQEKEKLAKDDVKHPQAAAAGDIAGMGAMAVAPEIPVVGAAIGSAIKGGETASKIPSYLGLAKRAVGLEEDVPTNNAGDGSAVQTNVQTKPMRKITKRGLFLNQETFIVSHSTFNSLREAKKKGMHWKRYLEEDGAYHDLREYAREKRKGPIIVEDENTGACMYVRYGDI